MNNKNRKTFLLIFGVGIAIIISLFLFLDDSGQEYVSDSGVLVEAVPTGFPDYKVARVGVREAKRVYDEENAIILDVRSAGSYQQTHIPNALSVPLVTDDYQISEPKDAIIFTYCT